MRTTSTDRSDDPSEAMGDERRRLDGTVLPTRIVVPLDGSTASARSLRPAAALARATGADLSLVSVVMPSFVSTVTDRIRGQAAHAGIVEPAITLDVSSMAPADRLLASLDPDPGMLLCMATTGRSRFGQILGSVSEALLRARTGPFVLIGPECDPDAFGGGGPIVVPVDGSDTADSALSLAATWSRALGLTPELVTVSDADHDSEATGEGDPWSAILQRRATELGDEIGRNADVGWEVLQHPKPGQAIVDHAGDVDASLIVMATHGRTGLARVVLGSVALEVAHRSPCPVLVHRPLHLRA